ncbi:MAG TPA: thrombospondin type 3 repeat-containing protein [Polyangiaceae bacterium]|nr:thrombospondin type 3 repeat-containing protein [Polyangiaceae bacterium]
MKIPARPNRFRQATLTLLAASAFASAAHAQTVQGEVSVQRFDPAPGPRNFITTRSARTDGSMTWTAGLMANYAYQPFTVKECRTAECTGNDLVRTIYVVENMVTADAYGSFTIVPRLQIGLKVPVSWVKGQGIDANGDPLAAGLSAVGLGDIQLEAKGRIYGEADGPFTFGAYLYGTAPLGSATAQGSFIGNGSPTVGGALIGDGRVGDFTYGVNVGGIYRSEVIIGSGTTLGPEGRWSAAVGYQVGPIVRVIADAFGSTNFSSDLGANSIEVDGGAQIVPLGSKFTFTAGGGAGVFKGIGIPTARAFLGVVYSAESKDRDGDGLSDASDACPTDAEDKDGVEDSDGCPDLDNDADGLPDSGDKCPNQAEDVDGIDDKDGCPDLDNDKDGVPDLQDHCPAEPETMNGVDDLDGCPDAKDQDSDGIEDDKDKCPGEAEDTDGFEDTDGCPDPDNDKDGIPDNQDECADQKEDGKGKGAQKNDGCPIDA